MPYKTRRIVDGGGKHVSSTKTSIYVPPLAYPPPGPLPRFTSKLHGSNPIEPSVLAPVPRPHFAPLPPQKSTRVQQRRFALAPPANAPPNNPGPAEQRGHIQPNVTMSQYRLRSYGYAMVEEDRNAGWVLAYEEPEVSAARGRGKLWPGDLLREKELFELAEWIANMKGTDYNRRQYFKFEAHQGNLPFKNLDKMYHAIDNFEHGPEYKHFTFELEAPHGADIQHVYSQNPIHAIEDLIGEPEWKDQMSYAP